MTLSRADFAVIRLNIYIVGWVLSFSTAIEWDGWVLGALMVANGVDCLVRGFREQVQSGK